MLLLVLFGWLRYDMKQLEDRLDARLVRIEESLDTPLVRIEGQISDLSERMARVEGRLDAAGDRAPKNGD